MRVFSVSFPHLIYGLISVSSLKQISLRCVALIRACGEKWRDPVVNHNRLRHAPPRPGHALYFLDYYFDLREWH